MERGAAGATAASAFGVLSRRMKQLIDEVKRSEQLCPDTDMYGRLRGRQKESVVQAVMLRIGLRLRLCPWRLSVYGLAPARTVGS